MKQWKLLKCRSMLMEDRSPPNPEPKPIDTDKWWNQCKYFQWLQRYARFEIDDMANHIKMAVIELTKRALPTFNYNPFMNMTQIMDNINDLAKYTLASWHLVVDIKNTLEMGKLEWCPLQVDFMVIPQRVAIHRRDKYATAPFDIRELVSKKRMKAKDQVHGFSMKELKEKTYAKGKENSPTMDTLLKPHKYSKIEILEFGSETQEFLWDLEEIMDHPKVGYHKNQDRIDDKESGYYWMDTIDINQQDILSLKKKMYSMLKKCQDMFRDLGGGSQRYRRYVFIIDRRDEENLRKQNMKHNLPNNYKGNGYKKSGKDKIYLIDHQEYNTLPRELDLIQEMGLVFVRILNSLFCLINSSNPTSCNRKFHVF